MMFGILGCWIYPCWPFMFYAYGIGLEGVAEYLGVFSGILVDDRWITGDWLIEAVDIFLMTGHVLFIGCKTGREGGKLVDGRWITGV